MEGLNDSDEEYTQELGNAPHVRLEEGIYLRDLIEGQPMNFTLQPPEDNVEDEQQVYFTEDQLLQHARPECAGLFENENDENEEESNLEPFEKIAKTLTNIREDGKVKKGVIKEGTGDVVPAGAHVTLHYNGYKEYYDEPFDSTYMRRIPLRLRLGQGQCIIGFEEAVLTMRKGEISKFMIHPDLAYGPRGCEPRIPKNATLLFEISVEDFINPSVADAYDNMTELEKQQSTFEHAMNTAKAFNMAGVDLFKKQHYGAAASKFERAKKAMDDCKHMPSPEESEEHRSLMIRLHVNLAVCSNKKKEYKRACTNCRMALELEPGNAKAHYNYGNALLNLCEFKQAEHHLKAAQRREPHNEEINAMLVTLEKKWTDYKNSEADLAFKMMKGCGLTPPAEQQLQNLPEDERAFIINLRNKLDKFQESDNKQLDFPPSIGLAEESLFKKEAQKRGLKVTVVRGTHGAGEHIRISKPTSPVS